MIDEPFRRWLARRAVTPVSMLARAGVTPNGLTWAGCALGLVAALLVARGAPHVGIGLWLVSRVLDGFDGLLARQTGGGSLYGGYLDITLDMVAYSAMALGFAFVMPEFRLRWALVLTGYILAITTTLALSSLAERADRQLGGNRSLQFTPGLAEAGETTIVYVALAMFPSLSRWIIDGWIVVLALTAIQRTWLARRLLRS
jgi:phosphatidylglycerophosphate synthase